MKILEELYYGNIRPDVKFYGKDSIFAEIVGLLISLSTTYSCTYN